MLVIGTWPGYEEVAVKRLCQTNGIDYLNVNQDIFLNKKYPISRYEGHFNAARHYLIAQRLAALVQKNIK